MDQIWSQRGYPSLSMLVGLRHGLAGSRSAPGIGIIRWGDQRTSAKTRVSRAVLRKVMSGLAVPWDSREKTEGRWRDRFPAYRYHFLKQDSSPSNRTMTCSVRSSNCYDSGRFIWAGDRRASLTLRPTVNPFSALVLSSVAGLRSGASGKPSGALNRSRWPHCPAPDSRCWRPWYLQTAVDTPRRPKAG